MESKFQIYISGDRIFSNSQKAFQLKESKNLGEIKESKIVYSPFEALYLIEKNLAELVKNNKKISQEHLIRISKNKDFHTKYLVFKYLKSKGFIVKTGIKFGEEFRVYKDSMNQHSKWICFPVKASEKINPKDIIAKSRITHSTGKKLLLAIVDSEEDISFYEIDWTKI